MQFQNKQFNAAVVQWCDDHAVDERTFDEMWADGQIEYGVEAQTSVEDVVAVTYHPCADVDELEKQLRNIKRRKNVVAVAIYVTNPTYIAWEERVNEEAEERRRPDPNATPYDIEPSPEWIKQFEEEQEAAIREAQANRVDEFDRAEISEADETDGWIRYSAAARYVGVLFQQVQQRASNGSLPVKIINNCKHVNLRDLDAWIARREQYFMKKMKREFAITTAVEEDEDNIPAHELMEMIN